LLITESGQRILSRAAETKDEPTSFPNEIWPQWPVSAIENSKCRNNSFIQRVVGDPGITPSSTPISWGQNFWVIPIDLQWGLSFPTDFRDHSCDGVHGLRTPRHTVKTRSVLPAPPRAFPWIGVSAPRKSSSELQDAELARYDGVARLMYRDPAAIN